MIHKPTNNNILFNTRVYLSKIESDTPTTVKKDKLKINKCMSCILNKRLKLSNSINTSIMKLTEVCLSEDGWLLSPLKSANNWSRYRQGLVVNCNAVRPLAIGGVTRVELNDLLLSRSTDHSSDTITNSALTFGLSSIDPICKRSVIRKVCQQGLSFYLSLILASFIRFIFRFIVACTIISRYESVSYAVSLVWKLMRTRETEA